jgi:nucleoside-diphosphate-sugar epimerase
MNNMNIIITGASGFVGKNLSPYLEDAAFKVRPLSLREQWQQNLPVGYDAIIHLAGKAHDTKNTSVAAEYFQINTELTKELFDIFLQSSARDFIYFSSVKAAADNVAGTLDEQVLPNPQTPYGKSKQEAEQYILSKNLPNGKRVFIMRPCMIHGPGNKGNLNLLYQFVGKGIPYPLAAFENRRSFLSVDNLCFAVKEILQHQHIKGGIYNLADDEALSTNDVVTIIAKTLRKKPRLLSIPQGLLKGMAKIGDAVKLPLNSERLKKLTENYVVSNAKIKQALGIAAFPVTAREGLSKTIQSFLSE